MDLKGASHNILDQLKTLIEDLSLEDFTTQVPVLNDSTIGQHTRQTLEFFICLNKGISKGTVNYDERCHDKRMEQDRLLTLQQIDIIKESLLDLDEEETFLLGINYGLDEESNNVISTNVSRELAYNIEHAIHHMAIIKIGVRSLRPDILLPKDFGIAASTIKYQEALHAVAQ